MVGKAKRAAEPERRSYQQFCGVARALDVVGERWTLLIARNLLLGPRRYSDFLAELPGITTNLLAKRLREMEAGGLVAKREASGVVTYELTERGAALEPVVLELGRWGWPLLGEPRPGDRVDLALGLISLKRRYAGGAKLTVGLEAGARAFALLLTPARLVVRDRAADSPDLRIAGDEPALRALLIQGKDAAPLRASGALAVDGAPRDWARFVAAFGLVDSRSAPLPHAGEVGAKGAG
jgi:DNA-binding HxlR family transcriptional regulator